MRAVSGYGRGSTAAEVNGIGDQPVITRKHIRQAGHILFEEPAGGAAPRLRTIRVESSEARMGERGRDGAPAENLARSTRDLDAARRRRGQSG
jgi:hypothetical protein